MPAAPQQSFGAVLPRLSDFRLRPLRGAVPPEVRGGAGAGGSVQGVEPSGAETPADRDEAAEATGVEEEKVGRCLVFEN